jgi:uncharacterized SAM-binding protein YcdF (DUF218 family)
MIWPIDICTPNYEVSVDELRGELDAIAVVANGGQVDFMTRERTLSHESRSRFRRAQKLARDLNIPIIISGSDGDNNNQGEAELLTALASEQDTLLIGNNAHTTNEHAAFIASVAAENNLTRIGVFTTGLHAFRTRTSLQARGVDVPIVMVRVNDSLIRMRLMDWLPSFRGFYYWKIGLKEYIGLLHYWRKGYF